MIPSQILDQIADRTVEGLALAVGSDEDGAVMEMRWCNDAFTKITGFELDDILGQRGSILIGQKMPQTMHLRIMERLMCWEPFEVSVLNSRKNGEPFWQQMCWSPLLDSETGQRWWLYSLVELFEQPSAPDTMRRPFARPTEDAAMGDLHTAIARLERENVHLRRLARSVTKESNKDALTGLSNRRHFEIELKAWAASLQDEGGQFAVLYIDLDRFKAVNDSLGHDAGDRLLISVAQMLKGLVKQDDFLARIGGDAFVIFRRLGDSALSISDLADAIVERMRQPFAFEGQSAASSASVGVAIATKATTNPEQVVADADRALYHAKAQGRGRWSFFTDEMHAELADNKQLAADLLVACEREEFIVFLQPIVDVRTGRLVSAEALVRWQHPTRGLLAPAAFLEIAATVGVLRKVDELVFAQLSTALKYLDEMGVDVPFVSVNASAERLADSNFIHDIRRSCIDPKRLIVEILESVSLDQMSDMVQWTFDELDQMGVTVAFDDFGTGHASIQGLLQIKPTVLKIDRQFIQPVAESAVSRSIVASIIGIGQSLGMRVVAEGVETDEQARIVRDMGCDYLQGYLFGMPMSAVDLKDVMMRTGGDLWVDAEPVAVGDGRGAVGGLSAGERGH